MAKKNSVVEVEAPVSDEKMSKEELARLYPHLAKAQETRQARAAERAAMTDADRDTADLKEAVSSVIARLTNGRNDLATVARRVMIHDVKRHSSTDENGNEIPGRVESVGTVSRERIEKALKYIDDAYALARSRIFDSKTDEDDNLNI